MSAWTPEPWPEIQPSGTLTRVGFGALPSVFIFHVDYERARACVGACAGMADPAAELERLRRDHYLADDTIRQAHHESDSLRLANQVLRVRFGALARRVADGRAFLPPAPIVLEGDALGLRQSNEELREAINWALADAVDGQIRDAGASRLRAVIRRAP